jgi:hypothetical protein
VFWSKSKRLDASAPSAFDTPIVAKPHLFPWLLFCVALVILFIINGIEYTQKYESTVFSLKSLITILKEVAFALIIAWAVSISIERISKSEITREITENVRTIKTEAAKQSAAIQDSVFRAMLKRNLPDRLVEEIKYVFENRFLRHNNTLTYLFSEAMLSEFGNVAKDFRVLRMKYNNSYTVENVSHDTEDYPVEILLEKPPFIRIDDYFKAGSKNFSLKIDGKDVPAEALKMADDLAPDDPNFKRFRYIISNVKPGNRHRVDVAIESFKQMADTEVFRTLAPTDGLTLVVKLPTGFVCQADALHRVDLEPISKLSTDGLFQWKLDAALIPNQGIMFWWVDPSSASIA